MNDFTDLWAEQLEAMDARIAASDWTCGCDPLGETLIAGFAWAYLPEPIGWHDPTAPHHEWRTHTVFWPAS